MWYNWFNESGKDVMETVTEPTGKPYFDSPGKLDTIKQKLMDVSNGDIDASARTWCEGFISALTDVGMISEDEFEHLMKWLGCDTSSINLMTESHDKTKH